MWNLYVYPNHKLISLDKNIEKEFNGYCKIENHQIKLNYYCKNHNELCCGLCISKIKSKGNGKHIDCNLYDIEDIVDAKNKI